VAALWHDGVDAVLGEGSQDLGHPSGGIDLQHLVSDKARSGERIGRGDPFDLRAITVRGEDEAAIAGNAPTEEQEPSRGAMRIKPPAVLFEDGVDLVERSLEGGKQNEHEKPFD
jgi:hypothetical protein